MRLFVFIQNSFPKMRLMYADCQRFMSRVPHCVQKNSVLIDHYLEQIALKFYHHTYFCRQVVMLALLCFSELQKDQTFHLYVSGDGRKYMMLCRKRLRWTCLARICTVNRQWLLLGIRWACSVAIVIQKSLNLTR